VTAEVPLLGADGYKALWNTRSRLAADSGLSTGWVEHLLNRYGSLTAELFAQVAERPELGRPLDSAPGYLAVEALYAATHEGALHLDDVLARRTRISIETWDRGVGAATEVAALVAPVLGWDEAQIAREVEHYTARVAAERESQHMPDDRSADAARLGAPDVRMGGLA
jgi:glycerol-3-phosphate dehydrogenase